MSTWDGDDTDVDTGKRFGVGYSSYPKKFDTYNDEAGADANGNDSNGFSNRNYSSGFGRGRGRGPGVAGRVAGLHHNHDNTNDYEDNEHSYGHHRNSSNDDNYDLDNDYLVHSIPKDFKAETVEEFLATVDERIEDESIHGIFCIQNYLLKAYELHVNLANGPDAIKDNKELRRKTEHAQRKYLSSVKERREVGAAGATATASATAASVNVHKSHKDPHHNLPKDYQVRPLHRDCNTMPLANIPELEAPEVGGNSMNVVSAAAAAPTSFTQMVCYTQSTHNLSRRIESRAFIKVGRSKVRNKMATAVCYFPLDFTLLAASRQCGATNQFSDTSKCLLSSIREMRRHVDTRKTSRLDDVEPFHSRDTNSIDIQNTYRNALSSDKLLSPAPATDCAPKNFGNWQSSYFDSPLTSDIALQMVRRDNLTRPFSTSVKMDSIHLKGSTGQSLSNLASIKEDILMETLDSHETPKDNAALHSLVEPTRSFITTNQMSCLPPVTDGGDVNMLTVISEIQEVPTELTNGEEQIIPNDKKSQSEGRVRNNPADDYRKDWYNILRARKADLHYLNAAAAEHRRRKKIGAKKNSRPMTAEVCVQPEAAATALSLVARANSFQTTRDPHPALASIEKHDDFLCENIADISAVVDNVEYWHRMLIDYRRACCAASKPTRPFKLNYSYDPVFFLQVDPAHVQNKLDMLKEIICNVSFDVYKVLKTRMQAASAFQFLIELNTAGIINISDNGHCVSLK